MACQVIILSQVKQAAETQRGPLHLLRDAHADTTPGRLGNPADPYSTWK